MRDIVSEIYFKTPEIKTSPIYVLFVYSIITQVMAAFLLVARRQTGVLTHLWFVGFSKENICINLATLIAFLFYFLAIASPLGAAMNAFVDYGVGPTVTALVGSIIAKEKLTKAFAWSAACSSIGIVVFAAPRLQAGSVSIYWVVGLLLALISVISGSVYRSYFKVLLNARVDKATIVLLRMSGLTVVLGAILLAQPSLFSFERLPETAALGLIGFSIPLFLSLFILQNVTIRSFAMLLFLYPILTYFGSAVFGLVKVYASDIAAAALVFSSITLHEVLMARRDA